MAARQPGMIHSSAEESLSCLVDDTGGFTCPRLFRHAPIGARTRGVIVGNRYINKGYIIGNVGNNRIPDRGVLDATKIRTLA
jgi:hypothetical protein